MMPASAEPGTQLAYFVHDLGDPAVHRRIEMLRLGGIETRLLGFSRGAVPPDSNGATRSICLGQTHNARMAQRTAAVLRAARRVDAWRDAVVGADIIMARQLETLVLAAMARRRFAPQARLAFECLDIHRLMLAPGAVGSALRLLERRLLSRCDLLLVSSPAFINAYFAKVHARLPQVCLVENRVLASELSVPAAPARPPGPPWRIGWFGVIRCRRSLQILTDLARRFPGLVEIVIRGRPAHDAIPDFDTLVASSPGVSFLGAYDRANDLPQIYADVHFVWAIDFYEAGANSNWLLPNRLYEGGIYGAVPIALRSVETGRWLAAHQAGVCLDEPLEQSLATFIAGLDSARHEAARTAMQSIPSEAFVCDAAACGNLAAVLSGRQAIPA